MPLITFQLVMYCHHVSLVYFITGVIFMIQVICYGQIIAAVVATTQDIADQAVRLVNVTYQPLKCITTIQVYGVLNTHTQTHIYTHTNTLT